LLAGAPPIRVLVGDKRHVTIDRALRLLGLGAPETVEADSQGRMDAHALRAALESGDDSTIVCAQAGEVNTGAFDDFEAIADATEAHRAWLHVDGAFGLWAAASPALRHLVRGAERADSWITDAHKWLNVPYDPALVLCARVLPPGSWLRGLRGAPLARPDGARRAPERRRPEPGALPLRVGRADGRGPPCGPRSPARSG
jgi:selenocysteine lyase/cysteine desulfurase